MGLDLNEKQKQLAELMVLEPELTNVEYAKRIKIDNKTLYAWKKKDDFKEYLHILCQEKFAELEKIALKQLHKQAEKGNWKAIEYILNNKGYKPPDKIETTNNTTITVEVED